MPSDAEPGGGAGGGRETRAGRHTRNALLFALGGAVVLASVGIGAILQKLTGARLDAEDQPRRRNRRTGRGSGDGGWLHVTVPDE